MELNCVYATDDLDKEWLPLHSIEQVASWDDIWVLRGEWNTPGLSIRLFGFDPRERQVRWVLTGLRSPSREWQPILRLAAAGGLAVTATTMGHNFDDYWLLGVEPQTGELKWTRPLCWKETRGKGKLYKHMFGGMLAVDDWVVYIENDNPAGEVKPMLRWIEGATGKLVYETPAPEIKRPMHRCGEWIYLYDSNDENGALWRVPASPLTQGQPQKLLTTPTQAVHSQGEYVYATSVSSDEDDPAPMLVCFRNGDDQPMLKSSIVIEGNRWDFPYVVYGRPDAPEEVIFRWDKIMCGFNLRDGALHWTREYELITGDFLQAGNQLIMHHFRGKTSFVDPLTGELTTAADNYYDRFLPAGSKENPCIVASSFLSHVKILTWGPALPTPVPVKPVEIQLRDLLPEMFKGPLDELEKELAKRAKKGSLDTLFKSIRALLGAGQVHPRVKAFLTALRDGEIPTGPLFFTPFEKLHTGCLLFSSLFDFGPGDIYFPALLAGGERGGVDFYVMLETGQVISLHHDASFSEVASDVWDDVKGHQRGFLEEFIRRGSALDIAQLVRYQQAFAGQDIDELSYDDYLQRTADAFGWKVSQLKENMEKKHLLLEFLRQPDD